MIEILEVKELEKIDDLRKKLGIEDENIKFLAMCDAGQELGVSAVIVKNETVFIAGFSVPGYDFQSQPNSEQIFILDSLTRASASYGETFGAKKIEILVADFYGFFQKRGFTVEEDKIFAPIGLIVKYK